MDTNIYDLLREITKNNQDEQEAIAGYYNLWKIANVCLEANIINQAAYNRIVSVIKIAISEELKHAELLNELADLLSHI